jgi:hypothetical protein
MSRPTGSMKIANLDNSPRLQRLLDLLCNGEEHSTLEIILKANVAAVSAAITELRRNLAPYGIGISCRKMAGNRYCYKLEVGI